jgi:hypothetical protein
MWELWVWVWMWMWMWVWIIKNQVGPEKVEGLRRFPPPIPYLKLQMEPCAEDKHTFKVTDPAFDGAYGEAVCHLLRRDPRVALASHRTDYTGIKLVIETRAPADAGVVFREACALLADEFDQIIRDLALAVEAGSTASPV